MKLGIINYGAIISDQKLGERILAEIQKAIKNDGVCIVDFKDVKSMATFNAKQIFGKLYIELGPENFFTKVEILNASEDIRIIITMGIQSAIEDSQKSK